MNNICKIIEKDGEEWIVFNPDFNQELTQDIIEFLSKHQRVEFGREFNKPVNKLPKSLTHLRFVEYSKFNQPVDNLPNSLTHLEFGTYFNQPINIIHASLKKITIPKNYSHPLPDNVEIQKI